MPDKDKERSEKIEDLQEKYPNVPTEIYDIEASDEMADMYMEEFGC